MNDLQFLGIIDIIGFIDFFYNWKEVIKNLKKL